MMALSRSMKNLMHDSAMARRGGGNPDGGGGLGRAMERGGIMGGRYNPGPKLQPRGPMPDRGPRGPVRPTGGRASMVSKAMQKARGGGILGRNPKTGGPGLPPRVGPKPSRGQVQIGVPGGRMPRPGGPGRVAGKPMPGGGTFGFASRGGGGTPALQQATAGAMSGAQQQAAMQRSRAAGPAAMAQPRGQTTAQRIGGTQGPPARRGGMARALGSGGSRRRMLR